MVEVEAVLHQNLVKEPPAIFDRQLLAVFSWMEQAQPEARQPKLLTLTQFAARHPAFTVSSLRWLRFRSEPITRTRVKDGQRVVEDLPGNGFAGAFLVVGGRVLIDEEAFFRIVDEQNGRGEVA